MDFHASRPMYSLVFLHRDHFSAVLSIYIYWVVMLLIRVYQHRSLLVQYDGVWRGVPCVMGVAGSRVARGQGLPARSTVAFIITSGRCVSHAWTLAASL